RPENFPVNKEIKVYATDFSEIQGDYEILNDYENVDTSLLTFETGSITLPVDIDEAGFYHIELNYFAYEGKNAAIERKIYINDEVPFDAASQVVFHRFYGSEDVIYKDYAGNDIRPSQIEKPIWTSTYIKDA